METETIKQCAGPFVDAKDCPVHRKDVLDAPKEKLQPTPRTDALCENLEFRGNLDCWIALARQLERELAEVQEKIADYGQRR